MARRALVIGSQLEGLRGVHNDVSLIANLLRGEGFVVETRTGTGATRTEILRAYEGLIADSAAGDTAVFSYSGHGGRARNEGLIPDGPERVQFIVPTDFQPNLSGPFRGIFAEELSELQARLTERTSNVTVVLDCCHAARMSRAHGLRQKALPEIQMERGAAEAWAQAVESLRAAGRTEDSNPDAVRVVACSPGQQAFEHPDENGRWHGLLTAALCDCLRGTDRPPWRTIGTDVRQRVLRSAISQRTEIEGPVDRIPFFVTEVPASSAFPVRSQGGRLVIDWAGPLCIDVGDEFELRTAGLVPSGQVVPTAVVERIDDGGAWLRVTRFADWVPPNCEAVLVRTARGVRPVAVRVPRPGDTEDGRWSAALTSRIDAAAGLRVADGDDERVLATVTIDGGVSIADSQGAPLLERPRTVGDEALPDTVRDLQTLARAARLCALTPGPDRLGVSAEFEWGLLRDGVRTPLGSSGEEVEEGTAIYLTLRNPAADLLYCTVFDIGLASRVTLVTTSEPSGLELEPGQAYTLGGDHGLPVTWPRGLPRREPRHETLLLLTLDRPVDLRPLQTDGVGRRSSAAAPGELAGLLAEVTSGMRDVAPPSSARSVRFDVQAVGFTVLPRGGGRRV